MRLMKLKGHTDIVKALVLNRDGTQVSLLPLSKKMISACDLSLRQFRAVGWLAERELLWGCYGDLWQFIGGHPHC